MEIHQLKYVLAIAKNRSFVRAANELSITPPALSQQVKKLEEELEVTLFERTTRSINLTPAGVEFVAHAQDVISSIYSINASMNRYAGSETGNISIGLFPAMGPYGLISLIHAYKETYPDIRLDLYEAECKELQDMLEKGTIDAAFSTFIDPIKESRFGLEQIPLVHDELVLITSSSHPFASKKSISLYEARNEEFIMQATTSGAYIAFMDACKKDGFKPKVIYHAMSNLTRFGFVAEGLGISSSSYKVAISYAIQDMAIIHIKPVIPRLLSLFTPKNKDSSPALANFKKFCLKWAKDIN